VNCSDIIARAAVAMAASSPLSTGLMASKIAQSGLDDCTVLHYFGVGDRIESVTLPAGSYFGAIALLFGLSAGLTNCAMGTGQAIRYLDARVVARFMLEEGQEGAAGGALSDEGGTHVDAAWVVPMEAL
jgi:hypothetical protein